MEIKDKILEIFPVEDLELLKVDLTGKDNIIITIAKKTGRIQLSDCEKASKKISEIFSDEYFIQVQSPGIGWNIHLPDEVPYFIDEIVKISYKEEDTDKIMHQRFILKGNKEDVIELAREKTGEPVVISVAQIVKIKTDL